jgi:alpha-ribazole phosphatase
MTDVPVDGRKAKRLARRVQRFARRAGLPRVIFTSDLRRCADVGRWLRRWGWIHHVDPMLRELDFGAWEGRRWSDIDRTDIDTWCCNFSRHAPGGGEALHAMLERAASWQVKLPSIMIAHAGWMLARRWQQEGRKPPSTAQDWPASPRHGECWSFEAGVKRL